MIAPTVPAADQLSGYDYPLEESLIAQAPAAARDRARLMVLDRKTGRIEHRIFSDLVEYLQPSDLVVLNDTRVIPARLRARKLPGGGRIEVLLLRAEALPRQWEALVRGSVPTGRTIQFEGGRTAVIRRDIGEGRKILEWTGEEPIEPVLDQAGDPPLPPYIRRNATPMDRHRYQTVYAARNGSVAAPTAGLHFTEALLNRIRAKGAGVTAVTLHIGIGTFRPVRCEDIRAHRMDPEWYEIGPEAAGTLNETRRKNGRVVAVGTTAARVLESAMLAGKSFQPASGWTDLFIRSDFPFQCVDALITNFHLPKSTLLMLVAAFAGHETIKRAYAEAVETRYRFLSYGDAMLIL